MDWESLLSSKRLNTTERPTDQGRSPFEKDYDRIVFCPAFRRLQRKTQVHPFPTNDHVHTRLTHSIEVSCVGRSLGNLVGQTLRQEDKLPNGFTPCDIGAGRMTSAIHPSVTPAKVLYATISEEMSGAI